MTRTLFLVAIALSTTHAAARCGVLVVPDDYPTINGALQAIAPYDTVLVRPGTYTENLYPYQTAFRLLSQGGPEATVVVGGIRTGTSWAPFDIVVRGFTFRESWGIGTGSGYGDRITIADSIIEDNGNDCGHSFEGGGISVSSSPLSPASYVFIDSCIIRRNVGCRGGGINIRNGVIRNTVVVDNSAVEGGGGVYLSGGRFQLLNCTVANNRVDPAGGTNVGAGIEMHAGSIFRLNLDRTIVALNSGGAGIYGVNIQVQPTISCTDAWANEGGNYFGVPDPTGTNGNIAMDPEFCDPGMSDFRLRLSSPCAPENSPPGCGLIGAQQVGCGVQGIGDQAISVPTPMLVVRPNPTSGFLAFDVSGPVGSAVIEIYSLRGTLVHVLSGRPTPIAWLPGAEIPSGVYFARTSAGDQAVVAKFILVR